MKGCTVLCLVLIISLSVDLTEGKEVIDSDTEEATNLLTKKLWTQIKKRLKDYGYDDHDLEDLDHELGAENDCSYDLVNGTIIRTHDSISQGATYISSPEIESREQCMQECCAMDNCNVAVFKENEEDHSCYLFDCGTPNICLFTSHPGYTVIKLPSRITSDKVQDKHEDDLENLAVETTTTTKPTTTTTTTAPVTEPEIKEPVSLFGRCTEHKDCAGSWSQCLGGYCVCKDSYHEQEGTCRKDCSKFEFECRNTGQPLAYPQCIAIYNKCDGIALCRDSSDEDSCDNDTDHPTNSKPSANTNTKPDKVDHPLLEPVNEKPAVDQDEPSEPSKSQDVTENKVISSSGSVSESEEDAIKPDPETSKSVEKSSSSDSSSDSITDDQPKTNPVNEKDPVDKSKPQDGKSDSAGKDADIEVVETAKEAESSDQGNSDNFLVETQEIQQLRHEGDLEKAEEDSGTLSRFYRSNKGAVVALSLGLTITAMLLVFVGCRLRNVKKKLRRGRPLNSNEADYLINGMYL